VASYATAIRGTLTVWLQRTVTRAALAVCLLVMAAAFVGLFVVGLEVPGSDSALDRPASRPSSDGQAGGGDATEDETTEGDDLGQISSSHVGTAAAGDAGESSPGDVLAGSLGSPGSLPPAGSAGVDASPTTAPAGGQDDDPPSGSGSTSTSTSSTQPTTTSPTTTPPTTAPAPPADGGLLGGLLDLLGLG